MSLFEPTVMDFFRAAGKMSCESFCVRFPWPVMIAEDRTPEEAFQSTPTHVPSSSQGAARMRAVSLRRDAPVLTLSGGVDPNAAEVTLGRSEDNDLVLHHTTVSGRHVVFRRTGDGIYTLEDLGSTNGTSVNGDALAPGHPVRLHDKDILSFGETSFKFYYPAGLYRRLVPRIPPDQAG